MKRSKPPGLESRRATDFERELVARARSWIPSWSLDDGQPDFGLALLKIAARFNSEVAERLDGVGEKMALGFLDWLGLRARAARAARMPVVFRLAETAREPVTAPRAAKMQVDALETTVNFETESELRVVPGTLAAIAAVDPANDAYYLPPPGLSSLEPLDPMPREWRLKSFAAANSKMIQLDPGLGLAEEMLIEIGGNQYRITSAADDLVSIAPPVPAGGFEAGARAAKVELFRPFDVARNRQEHILYVGDPDLLNIDAAARIELGGLPTLPGEVSWEYWGKDDAVTDPNDADPRWRALTLEDEADPDALIVGKPKGSIESTEVNAIEGRWIRARLAKSESLVSTDRISLRINPRADENNPPPALGDAARRGELPPLEAMVNTVASPTSNFYLLGREPRLFDTLYLGSAEAFSKPGATAWIDFDLSDGVFDALAFSSGIFIGNVLAGVDQSGALHLFSIGANGELSRFRGREPLRPGASGAANGQGAGLTSSAIQPAMWTVGLSLFVAVASGNAIWVWRDSFPFMGPSEWQSWGNLPPDTDPAALVERLVVVSDSGDPCLVALRKGTLFKCTNDGSLNWQPDWQQLDPNPVPAGGVTGIAGVRPEDDSVLPTRFLLTEDQGGSVGIHVVDAAGTAVARLANVASDVLPFGIEGSSGVNLAAVQAAPRILVARAATAGAPTSCDPQIALAAGTSIDGHFEGGRLVVYCNAVKPAGGAVSLAWLPFDAKLKSIAFQGPGGPASASNSTPITVAPHHAYLAGRGSGEILAAPLGSRLELPIAASAFKSAIALMLPAPQTGTGDTVIVSTGATTFATALVEGAARASGSGSLDGNALILLDRWLDLDTASRDVWIVPAGAASEAGNLDSSAPTTSQFKLASPLNQGDVLIVDIGGGFETVVIDAIDPLDPLLATVKPALSPAAPVALNYKASTVTTQGRVQPAIRLDASNNGWDIELLHAGDLYFPDLMPTKQRPLAIAPDPAAQDHAQWVALEIRWTGVPVATTFIVDPVLSGWTSTGADLASNPALAWEYWNGTGWWHLEIAEDETSNFRNSGVIRFKIPDDLAPVDWSGKTNHWVRARLIGGDYGRETVKVITATLPDGSTEQTVQRTSEGIRPPYALDVRVAYSVDQAVVPRLVLTYDSGTLRDQSDANRSPGAIVELFTPLGVTLARMDGTQAAVAGDGQCLPDCDCDGGNASTSAAPGVPSRSPARDPAVAGRAGSRALYLGFTAKLIGEPVNLLFLAGDEGAYERISPLAVDALIGDRFVPIVTADETRALGETGLVKMAFNVEPVAAELFGQTLSWLRLTPAGGSSGWAPSIAGIYPNAVWARAAETMTRELVGSSEGQPGLTLAVVRPPLLENSLELRVREPLGEEEREALVSRDPRLVLSDIPDMPGHWVLWRQVGDPVDCDPAERVYALDEATGTIRFGDGMHGMIPPAGTDSIVAFAYQRTEPAVGQEVPGNFVQARAELNLVAPVESVESVFAADRSAGGVAPESAERVLRFAPARLRHRDRAVSARDFEDLARQNSAEVVQARCLVRNGRVRLFVVMRGDTPLPSRAQQRELRRMLLAAAPAFLAAPGALTILGPELRRLRVDLVLRVAGLDVAGTLAREAKARLIQSFDTEHGGTWGEGWPMGSTPREDDIAEALLDLAGLEGIVSIALLEVEASGAERPWTRAVGSSELARLAPVDIRIGFDVVEAVA